MVGRRLPPLPNGHEGELHELVEERKTNAVVGAE